ncbi:MAG: hypothetical protein ABGY24_18320 [bacterium]
MSLGTDTLDRIDRIDRVGRKGGRGGGGRGAGRERKERGMPCDTGSGASPHDAPWAACEAARLVQQNVPFFGFNALMSATSIFAARHTKRF